MQIGKWASEQIGKLTSLRVCLLPLVKHAPFTIDSEQVSNHAFMPA